MFQKPFSQMIEAMTMWWKQSRCHHNIHYTRIARDGVIVSRYRCGECGKAMNGPHPFHPKEDYEWFRKSKQLGPNVMVVLREYKAGESQTLPQTPYEIHANSTSWQNYI